MNVGVSKMLSWEDGKSTELTASNHHHDAWMYSYPGGLSQLTDSLFMRAENYKSNEKLAKQSRKCAFLWYSIETQFFIDITAKAAVDDDIPDYFFVC